MLSTQPRRIPRPWAYNGSAADIPDIKPDYGRGSWQEGFPTETTLPLASGGVPPHHLDFNGVLKAISAHLHYLQNGGLYAWSNEGNYNKQSHVLGADGAEYVCLNDNGPEVAANAGGYIGSKDPTDPASRAYWLTLPEYIKQSVGFSADDMGEGIILEGDKLALDPKYRKKQVMVLDAKPSTWPADLADDGLLIIADGRSADTDAALRALIQSAANDASLARADALAARSAMGTATTDIATLKVKDATHDSEIASLKGRVDDHDTEIAQIRGSGTASDSTISNLMTKVSVVEAEITGLKGSVDTNTSDIADIKQEIAKSDIAVVGTTPATWPTGLRDNGILFVDDGQGGGNS